MKIGIDATSLCRKITGIERYTLDLVKNILSVDDKNSYFIFFRKEIHPELAEFKSGAEFMICPIDNQMYCEQIWLPYIAWKKKIDLTHFPAFPPGLFTFKKHVLTIHDAAIWKFVKTLSWKGKYYFRPLIILGSKRAVKIVTVSESSKKDIADCGGISAHKITNTGEAISKNFKIIEKREELESIRKKYNLPQKFILSVGSIEPRKNLTFLLSVYKKLKEKIQKPEHKLVLAGRKAWGRNSIFEKIKELKLEKDVLMTGHVSGNDLAGIYNLAGIFVYPSFYEGFGLPPLEAMACGTPVIASDIPALRETLGNAAIFAGPYDVNGFAGAVESLLNNSNLSESLKTKAIERSRVFSWEKTAKNTIEIYQSLQ